MTQRSQKPQSSEWVGRYVVSVGSVSAGAIICTISGIAVVALPVEEGGELTLKQALAVIFWFVGFFMCLIPLLSAFNDIPFNKEKSG